MLFAMSALFFLLLSMLCVVEILCLHTFAFLEQTEKDTDEAGSGRGDDGWFEQG